MIPVILSGGSGTRLWPVSRSKYPKQFCPLFEDSLQNLTLKRLGRFGKPMIVTSKALRDFTLKKAEEAGFSQIDVIFEPIGKNTAPAIALLCRVLELKKMEQEVVGVFPADHLVQKEEVFSEAIELGIACAFENKVVTLGLKPTEPATGYGYIQVEKQPFNFKKQMNSYRVRKFHEKPNLEIAKEFLKDGSYFWNAGIFIFKVSKMIELFVKFQPQIWDSLKELKADFSNIQTVYEKMPSISIDYAIMENLSESELLCVPCDPHWSDVGSWDAVSDVYHRNGQHPAKLTEVDSKNNFVLPYKNKHYAFVGVENLIVVDTDDALMISEKGASQDVKIVVDRLKKNNPQLIEQHTFEERPWGRFEILRDEVHFKSKVIRVDAGQQLSLQSHTRREEHWVVVKGTGEVVVNEEVIPVAAGSYVKIPLGAKHRMRNNSKESLEFIEVQLGSYFGEDDITRYQDDYNRGN